jgi:hypothetical protein
VSPFEDVGQVSAVKTAMASIGDLAAVDVIVAPGVVETRVA